MIDYRCVPGHESIVLLLVEEVTIADNLVWVVTGKGLWRNLLIGVPEVDIAHVIGVHEHIWVEGIVVPEVVLVVVSFPVAVDHEVEEAAHACEHVRPEDGSNQVEPGVDRAQNLIVGVVREALVSRHVREGLLEGDEAVLHEGERAEPKDGNTGASVRPPMPVEVHFEGLVEDAISTPDSLSINSFSEISNLLWKTLNLVAWLPRVRLIKLEELLAAACHVRHLSPSSLLCTIYLINIYYNLIKF